MKIRTDFVTNSSSSSYLITLTIEDVNASTFELNGWIYAPDDGHISGSVDPKKIGKAGSFDELKQRLLPLKSLCSIDFIAKDSDGNTMCSTEEVCESWSGDELNKENYNQFIQTIEDSLHDIKSVHLCCKGEQNTDYFQAKVEEEYEYYVEEDVFTADYSAIDNGRDVTDEMLNDSYSIDCGDDSLSFQLKLNKRKFFFK